MYTVYIRGHEISDLETENYLMGMYDNISLSLVGLHSYIFTN